ncbi:glycosyltransferase [Aquirufa sp. HETE-83D]|uniref:Glycosyltransferase n=1 Tax=Aquirufa esocilacus TaxID=3096513 RepID=A0ABW6DKF2_9BACT
MSPLISIVMATYNGEKYLREQVDSLLAQSYPSLEFVFVDDASSDATLAILQEYVSRDPRIRLVVNPVNQGLLATFETGIRAAKGEIIALADQDDVWMSNKISLLAGAIGSHSMIYADSALTDAAGARTGKFSDRNHLCDYPTALHYVFGTKAMGHAMLFKREIIDIALPFPDYVGHDYILGFAAAALNGVSYFPATLVNYRQHSSNTMGADLSKGKKNYNTRDERNARIIKRLTLLSDRCPAGDEREILLGLAQDFASAGIAARIRRFFTVARHHRAMLAYKGKSALGSFLYSFKLLFSIF